MQEKKPDIPRVKQREEERRRKERRRFLTGLAAAGVTYAAPMLVTMNEAEAAPSRWSRSRPSRSRPSRRYPSRRSRPSSS